jgi:hypothetical protein
MENEFNLKPIFAGIQSFSTKDFSLQKKSFYNPKESKTITNLFHKFELADSNKGVLI